VLWFAHLDREPGNCIPHSASGTDYVEVDLSNSSTFSTWIGTSAFRGGRQLWGRLVHDYFEPYHGRLSTASKHSEG
jgi:hypothetical protein